MDMKIGGDAKPRGIVTTHVTRNLGDLRSAPPSWQLKNWLFNRRRDIPKLFVGRSLGRVLGMARIEAKLVGVVYRMPTGLAPWELRKLRELLANNASLFQLPRFFGGELTNYGVLSTRLVTDAGVAYLVDAMQGITEPENFKYHGYGTGGTAEGQTQTALVTELTTQYVSDNVRPTGSQTEASAAVYRTVGTLSPDTGGTIAITEHGIFSATAAGTMLDRSLFSAINLVAGSDSLQTTYDLTIAAGG